jgi:hypothetical protein
MAKEAKRLLDLINNGKSYTSGYVVSRFEKAAHQHPTDQLIGNMRDVLVKRASSQPFVTQKEIGSVYDRMIGLAGGHTAFRGTLGDLLPEDRQVKKVAYSGSNIRTMEENAVNPLYKDSELSNAFSVLFSMGNDSSFGSYAPGQDKSIEKAVIGKLSSLNCVPNSVKIMNRNEHFALCLAFYDTSSFNKVAVKLPVSLSNGAPSAPDSIIEDGSLIPLTSRNLLVHLKAQENEVRQGAHKKMAGMRGSDKPQIEIEKMVVPKSLERFADLENALIATVSKFDTNQIQMATGMIASELSSFGAYRPDVRVASSDDKSIMFDAFIPTELGRTVVHVPVEMPNGKPILPSRFAVDMEAGKHQVYDFSQKGYDDFRRNIKPQSETLNVARHTGELSKMSYHQLMDRVLEGVSSQDYKLSEDALSTIQSRFGGDQFKIALDKFSQLLRHSSSNSSQRKTYIEAAVKKGELIRVPTSVELYSPKLGLPLSKISFDDKGRVIAKGRRSKSDNIQDAAISSSRIVLT